MQEFLLLVIYSVLQANLLRQLLGDNPWRIADNQAVLLGKAIGQCEHWVVALASYAEFQGLEAIYLEP